MTYRFSYKNMCEMMCRQMYMDMCMCMISVRSECNLQRYGRCRTSCTCRSSIGRLIGVPRFFYARKSS